MKRNVFLGSLLLIPLLLIGYGIARPSHSTERVVGDSGRTPGLFQAQATYAASQPLNAPQRQDSYDRSRLETSSPFAGYGTMDPDRSVPGRMDAMGGPGMGMMGGSMHGRGMGFMGHGDGWGSLGGILGAIGRAIFGGGHGGPMM